MQTRQSSRSDEEVLRNIEKLKVQQLRHEIQKRNGRTKDSANRSLRKGALVAELRGLLQVGSSTTTTTTASASCGSTTSPAPSAAPTTAGRRAKSPWKKLGAGLSDFCANFPRGGRARRGIVLIFSAPFVLQHALSATKRAADQLKKNNQRFGFCWL